MTQRQKYEVIQMFDGIEVRRYLPYVAADVIVNGDYKNAPNTGFRPLANYIFSNKISMTAPVLTEEKGKDKWQISFVMPDGSNIKEMPSPGNNVNLRAEDEEICAALKFSGYTGSNHVKRMEAKLRKALAARNIAVMGSLRIARFDPPWKPGFLRHNELVLPINWTK